MGANLIPPIYPFRNFVSFLIRVLKASAKSSNRKNELLFYVCKYTHIFFNATFFAVKICYNIYSIVGTG
jgi:hypothetical protein